MARRRRIVAASHIVANLLVVTATASAQVDPCPKSVNQPPPASPALLRCVQAVFHPDGAQSLDNDTLTYYLRDIEGSDSTRDRWVRYDENAILKTFNRLIKTNFFDDLWVEVIDEPYDDGIPAKHVVFHMEERPRLKTFQYTGSKVVAVSKIGEVLNARGIVRFGGGFLPDAFILIRQIRGVIKELYAEAGYPDATIEVKREVLPPRLLRITFVIESGPKVRLLPSDSDRDFSPSHGNVLY